MTTTANGGNTLELSMQVGPEGTLAVTTQPEWDEIKDAVLAVRPMILPPVYERPRS